MSRPAALFAPPATLQETADAAQDLDRVLRAAGLGDLRSRLVQEEGEQAHISLNDIDAGTATELSRLIQKSMRRAYKAASALRDALRAHGLSDALEPRVHNAAIQLGELSISDADRLAVALGAPPQPDLPDVPDWPDAAQVYDRLDRVLTKATRGGFVDMRQLAYCERCDQEPAIALGTVQVNTARRLATALQFGA
ncbi:hypothetical protein [Streptomyces sp. NPDC001828]|uniref:hypothetical protein n=1 Tax=Streptomyces sp. NPDC001828 TaxID=3364615 RepID=UPI0036B37A17